MFESLHSLVKKAATGRQLAENFSASELCVFLDRLISAELPELSRQFRTTSFVRGVALVAVRSPAVAAQIHATKLLLLSQLKNACLKLRTFGRACNPLQWCIVCRVVSFEVWF